MNELIELVELLGEQNNLYAQVQELNTKLDPIKKKINKINESIPFSSKLHSFLCDKILETYTKELLEEVDEYRKQLKGQYPYTGHTETVYMASKIFDPYYDSWYIYDYEQEGDNVRFLVSCRKNEGSISGLMTFLDTHYTNWIKISDLEMFNDGI